MKVEMIAVTENSELLIEKAARVAYPSQRTGDVTPGAFLRGIVHRGHESVLEHASATFLISGISHACSHQLVRHRLANYTQKSQRHVNEENFEYVTPKSISESPVLNVMYRSFLRDVRELYTGFQDYGIKNEDARFVLPNAISTEVVMTANLREWRHIFKIRGSRHAQWEICEMVMEIFKILKKIAPNVFYDLEIGTVHVAKGGACTEGIITTLS